MKNLNKQFSTALKALLVLTLLFSFSCSSDSEDEPNQPNTSGNTEENGGNENSGGEAEVVFVTLPESVLTSYDGILTYNDFLNADGDAELASTGGNVYEITFSDDVPDITGLQFIAGNNDGEYVSYAEGESVEGVTVNTDGELDLAVPTSNGDNTGFSGEN